MIIGRKDRRLHEIHMAPTHVFIDPHEQIPLPRSGALPCPWLHVQVFANLERQLGLPLPPKMRISSPSSHLLSLIYRPFVNVTSPCILVIRACRVAEVGSPGERFQPKEHDVLLG